MRTDLSTITTAIRSLKINTVIESITQVSLNQYMLLTYLRTIRCIKQLKQIDHDGQVLQNIQLALL